LKKLKKLKRLIEKTDFCTKQGKDIIGHDLLVFLIFL